MDTTTKALLNMDGFSFSSLPLWLVFLISVGCLSTLSEVGLRIGRARSHNQPIGSEGAFGVATAALLGLVTFLLAFTFSIASSQYNERRAAVLNEANILGTALYRAELLPDAEAKQLRSLLETYLSLRLDVTERGHATQYYVDIIDESERLQAQMWEVAATVAKSNPTPTNALVVSALNDVFDIHTERVVYGLYRRIPPIIWFALLAVAGVGMGGMAYRTGALWQSRSELTPALIVAFAGVVTLIADIDNPQNGVLIGSQSPIVDLANAVLSDGS